MLTKSFRRFLLAATFAIAGAAATTAHAHARLESSEPQAASTVERSPKQLRLKFNEALEPAFSKVRLLDAANAEIPLGNAGVDQADARAMAAQLPPLRSGEYRVQWSAMAQDGHKTRGEFTFRVR
jgi:methionine-rich copper-binding protein CopC